VLIGAVALETLGLEVDPVAGELKEAKTYLLQVGDAHGEES
jgi:predicted aspartyl protease